MTNDTDNKQQLMLVKEAAKVLDVPYHALMKFVHEQKMQKRRYGHTFRYYFTPEEMQYAQMCFFLKPVSRLTVDKKIIIYLQEAGELGLTATHIAQKLGYKTASQKRKVREKIFALIEKGEPIFDQKTERKRKSRKRDYTPQVLYRFFWDGDCSRPERSE